MHYYCYYITLILIIFSTCFGNCNVENLEVEEGGTYGIKCLFPIGKYDDKNFTVFWLYPALGNEENRIIQEIKWGKKSLMAILIIKNTQKNKDEGNYTCILNNSTQFLREQRYHLKLNPILDVTQEENIYDHPKKKVPNFYMTAGLPKLPNNRDKDDPKIKKMDETDNNKIIKTVLISIFVICLLLTLVIVGVCCIRRRRNAANQSSKSSRQAQYTSCIS